MIGKRISEISFEKQEFEKGKGNYNKALEKSGFSKKLTYHKQGPVKRARTRTFIWFNPPYSSHFKTNVENNFIKLIIKQLPKYQR